MATLHKGDNDIIIIIIKIMPLRWSKKTRRDGDLRGETINTVRIALEALLVASKEVGI